MLTLHGLLSLLIFMIRRVNADGQLYVYILCVFLLIMLVNTIQFILTCCLWPYEYTFTIVIDFDHTSMLMNNFMFIFLPPSHTCLDLF